MRRVPSTHHAAGIQAHGAGKRLLHRRLHLRAGVVIRFPRLCIKRLGRPGPWIATAVHGVEIWKDFYAPARWTSRGTPGTDFRARHPTFRIRSFTELFPPDGRRGR